MSKYLCACVIFLSLLSGTSTYAAEDVFERVVKTKTIRCGYFQWPPYIVKDPNTGKFSGINYEITEALAANLDLKVEWVAEIGVGEVPTALNTHKADVMCASIWPSFSRMANMTLTNPIFFDEVYAFVRKDDKRFDGDLSKANTKEIKVSGIDGDVTAELAIEKLPKATRVFLPQMASGAEVLMQLITKKADIVIVDQGLVNDFLKTHTDQLRKVDNIKPVRVFTEHMAVKKGEYHLRDMLNISLQQLVNDGVIEKITNKFSREYNVKMISPAKSFAQ